MGIHLGGCETLLLVLRISRKKFEIIIQKEMIPGIFPFHCGINVRWDGIRETWDTVSKGNYPSAAIRFQVRLDCAQNAEGIGLINSYFEFYVQDSLLLPVQHYPPMTSGCA